MEPFNKDATCPKCGGDKITSRFIEALKTISFHGGPARQLPNQGPDYMKRKCAGCGYGWREAPLDAKGD